MLRLLHACGYIEISDHADGAERKGDQGNADLGDRIEALRFVVDQPFVFGQFVVSLLKIRLCFILTAQEQRMLCPRKMLAVPLF